MRDGLLRILALALLCGAARAEILLVRADGSGDFPTIQLAIVAAAPGDTVGLADGVYTGPGNWNIDYLRKLVHVVSLGGDPDSCVIDCFDGNVRHRAVTIEGSPGQPVLAGITLRGGRERDRAGALYVADAAPLIRNCRFVDNVTEESGGALFQSLGGATTLSDCTFRFNRSRTGGAIVAEGSDLVLVRCIFDDNSAHYRGGAVVLSGGGNSQLSGCLFRNNRAEVAGALAAAFCRPDLFDCTFVGNMGTDDGGALHYYQVGASGGTARIAGCTMVGNWAALGSSCFFTAESASHVLVERSLLAMGRSGAAVYAGEESVPVLMNCDLFGNEGGDWTGPLAGQAGQKGNFSANPLFCDLEAEDFTLHDISPCLPANNEGQVLVGAHGLGCQSDGYVVFPDRSGVLSTIQDGVGVVPTGGVLELADGVFTGPGNRDVDFGGREITVRSRSGDPTACVIDCQGGFVEPHRGFRFGNGEGPLTVLEGVTVRNGYAAGHGGAVLVEGAGPTLRNCLFLDSVAVQHGGAVACFGGAAPLLERCVLAGCSGLFGGALHAESGSLVRLSGCTVAGNTAQLGGGITALGASVDLAHSLVVGNLAAGALFMLAGGVATLACCDLYGNVGGDWTGEIVGQLGRDGNRCADPCFCPAGSGLYEVCEDSWCLPGNNPDGCAEIIGVSGGGCVPCDCHLETSLWLRSFRVRATGAGVVATWQTDPSCDPAGFRLAALLGDRQWEVPHAAGDAGLFTAADTSGNLAVGGRVVYTLAWGLAEPRLVLGSREILLPAAGGPSGFVGARPNPCNPRTVLAFALQRPGPVRVALFDLAGRRVAVLEEGFLPAGTHEVLWEGTDLDGRPAPSGVYLARLRWPGGEDVLKVILAR